MPGASRTLRAAAAALAVASAAAPAPAPAATAPATSHGREVAGLPFVPDDYPAALADARARSVPLVVDAWAPW